MTSNPKDMAGPQTITTLSTHRSCPTFSLYGRQEGPDRASTVPGPGKYGEPPHTAKFRKAPQFGFGTSVRAGEKKWDKIHPGETKPRTMPGPGAYSADDPNLSAPQWGFGTQPRVPKVKHGGAPAPGRYEVRGDMKGISTAKSMAGRRPGGRSLSAPGPGHYTADHSPTQEKLPKWAFGTGNRTEDVALKVAKKLPGPGKYETLPDMGGNPVDKMSLSFSFNSRRPPAKSDATPGPGRVGHYTQF